MWVGVLLCIGWWVKGYALDGVVGKGSLGFLDCVVGKGSLSFGILVMTPD